MKMISAKEASKIWNITERRITGLCRNGSIPGAIKNGKCWEIPIEAKKPIDNRIKTGEYIIKKSSEILPLPVGISDYRLASTKYYYIDKTLMLKDFIDERPMVTLFTRPRRFGKTLNMDMIRTFFEISNEDTSKYFINKNIWSCGNKYRVYQGKYPVIFISLKDIKHKTWEETFESIKYVIESEYSRHNELKNSQKLDQIELDFYKKILSRDVTNIELEQSLLKLSIMLNKHYEEKTVIIIDEYDTPIQNGYMNGFYDEVISFMRNSLSRCLKDNASLAFGFLTGILRVAEKSIFSGLNNLTINSILDNKYSQYFGFTYNEVEEMAKYYGAVDKLDELCEWYDGYKFGNTEIFNPWSVINYFSNNFLARPFSLSTSSNKIIGELLNEANEDIYSNLTSLLNGNTITTYVDTSVIYPQIKNNPSSIYSFLLVAGYLKIVKSSISITGEYICELSIPNKEISFAYRKEILQYFNNMISEPTSVQLEEALLSANTHKLSGLIGKFLTQSVSSFDALKENFYQGFLLGICTLFGNFYVTSNRESGDGRYDIQLMPKTNNLPGIIIEIKAIKNADDLELKSLALTALKQINDKKYDTELKEHNIKTIYKYGIAFSGKHVEIETELLN